MINKNILGFHRFLLGKGVSFIELGSLSKLNENGGQKRFSSQYPHASTSQKRGNECPI
jgi:hypothetical protein